jgi:TolB protein
MIMLMRKFSSSFTVILLALTVLLAGPATAQSLNVDIVGGVKTATPIVVVPFAQQGGAPLSTDIADVMRNDFNRSGKFRSLAKSDIVETPSQGSDIKFATWRLLKQDYITVGRISDAGGGMLKVDYELWDVNKQQSLLAQSFTVPAGDLRGVAHQIADQIYEKVTGVRGAFWTRIAYITAVGLGDHTTYSLIVADSDGFNPQVVARSKESLLSPAWSPDGRKIAYVSFESGNSNIYIQDITTGARQLVSSHKGINGAPAFSPDGSKLALSLSYVGNPEIFVLDLASRQDRYRTEMGAGRSEHLFHFRPLRPAADLSDVGQRWHAAADKFPGPEQPGRLGELRRQTDRDGAGQRERVSYCHSG